LFILLQSLFLFFTGWEISKVMPGGGIFFFGGGKIDIYVGLIWPHLRGRYWSAKIDDISL
jgi:hypothetical protein